MLKYMIIWLHIKRKWGCRTAPEGQTHFQVKTTNSQSIDACMLGPSQQFTKGSGSIYSRKHDSWKANQTALLLGSPMHHHTHSQTHTAKQSTVWDFSRWWCAFLFPNQAHPSSIIVLRLLLPHVCTNPLWCQCRLQPNVFAQQMCLFFHKRQETAKTGDACLKLLRWMIRRRWLKALIIIIRTQFGGSKSILKYSCRW